MAEGAACRSVKVIGSYRNLSAWAALEVEVPKTRLAVDSAGNCFAAVAGNHPVVARYLLADPGNQSVAEGCIVMRSLLVERSTVREAGCWKLEAEAVVYWVYFAQGLQNWVRSFGEALGGGGLEYRRI